ncbi:MAG: PaaX family transcriptional regulator C-terminal domain-containing protein, partial [Limnohabitans sp.]
PLARECQDPAFFDTDTQKAKSFILRLLLIHDYRRLLLRDPLLPSDLLPAHWPGDEARHICKSLYETLRLPSELFLNSELQLADGRKTKSLKILRQRFQNC